MTTNPWHRLPLSPPYLLPEDEQLVRTFNERAGPNRFLHVDVILPEAFVGARNAPVVVLSNNPGFTDDGAVAKQSPTFMAKMRKNLLHEDLAFPFVFLDPDFGGPGRQWWERKLKHLLARFGREIVARSVANVPYFPYPSRRFAHEGLRLPSQEYTFDLVRRAVERQAVIVFMRQEERWLCAVPELKNYARLFRVINSQNPTISPGNCKNFHDVVAAIES